MTTFSLPRRPRLSPQLFMLLFFFVGTLFVMPLSLFVFDNDEGINVIKAVLMADGYPLYTQTWSDQPPIFTQLLQGAFALFGEKIVVARLLVLALTTLFVWGYTGTIRLQLGTPAAWIALLLLMLADNFLRLSLSVMIGLPALSFAMVALYLLQLYKGNARVGLLLLAGLLMGLALQTKFLTIVLVPVIGLDLLAFGESFGQDRARFWRQLRDAFIWGAITVGTFLLIGLYYNALDLSMLLGAHLGSTVQAAYDTEQSWADLLGMLRFDYGHLLLALLGLLLVTAQRDRRALLPMSWLLFAFLLLSIHRPIWYHHYPLIAIPLCWLAAYLVPHFTALFTPTQTGTQTPTQAGTPLQSRALFLLLTLMMVGLIYLRGERTIPYYNQRSYDAEVVTLLQSQGAQGGWVFADQAIYPFYAGLPVPPEIAVFSRKRFFGENLNNQILLDVMRSYQPAQVLLTRFKGDLLADPEFAGYLAAHYTTVQETADYGYYQRR